MSISTTLKDRRSGRDIQAGPGPILAVGPLHGSQSYNALLGVDATVVNVVPAESGQVFVITAILMVANKLVSNTVDAVVQIYEADDAASGTALNEIITVPIARSSTHMISPLYMETSSTRFVNAVTSDDDVYVTIFGFYREE